MLWVMLGSRMVRLGVSVGWPGAQWSIEANSAFIVWWEDVCEDALTAKGLNTQLRVIGGGAANATDKVRLSHETGGKGA
jgi:hypothetical protein